jgi:hypothetical protein
VILVNWADYVSFGEKVFPALVGFAGAWAGSRWGVTKFKREKYWDGKVKAYETVLIHFEQIAFWGRCNKAQAYCGVTIGDNNLLPETFSDSMRSLAQLEITSFIYFDNDFMGLVKEYRHKMESIYINNVEDLKGEDSHLVYYGYANIQGDIGDVAYKALELLNQQASQDIGGKLRWYEQYWKNFKGALQKDWENYRRDIQ